MFHTTELRVNYWKQDPDVAEAIFSRFIKAEAVSNRKFHVKYCQSAGFLGK
jgi:hypothetical protein